MSRNKPSLVVVTGAGSGIGRATTLRFAKNGAVVIAADINLTTAEETAKLVADAGGVAHASQLDVTDEVAWEEFAAEVSDAHGVADVVVNNAGFTTAGAFLDHSAADWDRLMAVNVYGVINGCRVFAKQMVDRGRGGQLINVASAGAYIPIPLSSPYCTTKTAVLMLSQCLRVELGRHNIGVTAICPGFIDTGFYTAAEPLGMDEEKAERMRNLSVGAAGTFGSSADSVAAAIVRAAHRNPAIQPVTAEAHVMYALSRLSPGMLRFGAQFAVVDRGMAMVDRYVPDAIQNRLFGAGAR